MNTRSLLSALFTLGMVMAVPTTSSSAEPLDFRLDWSLQGTHSPFFLAKERGYFADEGLEVNILEGQGSATVVKLVASGSAEPIGFADYATMMKGVQQGAPVTAVFGINQKSPMIILSRADNPVPTPKDMEGKIIAMAPAESTAQVFPALVAAQGVDESAINVLNPAVGAKMALLLQGRVDAITAGLNGQVPQVEAKGLEVSYFLFADHGVNTLNNGIIVNNEFMKSNPEMVRGFLRAIQKGWQDAIEDPEAAIAAILAENPDRENEREVFERQLELTFETLSTSNTEGHPLGWMAAEDWEATQKLLHEYAGLPETRPVETYFTNEYIAE